MFDSMLFFWLGLGVILTLAEVILPGLVSVFVGLGALTVALLLHLNSIDNIPSQLITWFASSIIYIFSLRLLIMRLYPSDRSKQDIDEDRAMIGQRAEVTEPILNGKNGRIRYGDSTWIALSDHNETIPAGSQVEIVDRENISWIVKPIHCEEK